MSEHLEKSTTVASEAHGLRIDSMIAQWIPEYSRSQISNWIKMGAVTLNHKPCKPKDKISVGDLIAVNINLNEREVEFNLCQAEDIPLDIIYEDNEVLVLNKAAGMVVHPGAGNPDHTLVHALLHHEPNLRNLPRAGIIHRLDKDTTGLLVVAKSLTAHTSLIRQMQAREIQRQYIALVQGHVIGGGTLDTGFGRHPKNRLKMTVTGQGRQAITHYTVNRHYHDYTLLDVSLMTGRTHQIRVHMAYIHHPIVGDPLYGGRMRLPSLNSEPLKDILHGFKRQALHALTLGFTHPKTNERLTCEAPIPEDFDTLLHALDDYYGY